MSTVRIQVRRGLHDDWLSVDPVLAPGEMGLETDTHLYKFGNEAGDVWSDLAYANENPEGIQNLLASYVELVDRGAANGVAALDANKDLIVPGSSIIVEGVTDNGFETTLAVTDPTADRTITFPNATGTVSLTSDLNSYVPNSAIGGATGVAGLDASSNLVVPGASIIVEGSTDNAYETTITVTDPTADRSISMPNASGTVITTGNLSDITSVGTLSSLTVSGDLTVSGTTTTVNSTTVDVADKNLTLGNVDTPTNTTANGGGLTLKGATDKTLTWSSANSAWNSSEHIALNAGKNLVFEGATDDSFETTLTVSDPTADRTITFPDVTGTVAVQSWVSDALGAYVTTASVGSSVASLTGGKLSSAEIPTSLATTTYASSAASAAQQAAEATAAGALSTHEGDTTNIHGITDTAALATKTGTETFTNKTLTSPKINEDVAVTATATEINTLDGITASTAELNILDGATLTVTELNYVDGVTSGIQTQLDAKLASSTASTTYAPLASPTFTGTVTLPANTISQSMMADDSVGTNEIGGLAVTEAKIASSAVTEGKIADSAVTSAKIADGTIVNGDINASAAIDWTKLAISSTVSSTELGYVDGVTSAIQTQIDAKAPKAAPTFTGTLTAADVTISGNLTVSGTTTTVNTTNFTTSDPVIYLGDGNNANLVDIGFVGSYNDGTYAHQGLVKDSSDGKWKLFKGVTDEPTTTVNFAQGSLDALKVGAFEASSAAIGNVSNTELQYLDGVTSAIQTQIDAKAPTNNASFTGTFSAPSGTVTSTMIANDTIVNADINSAAAIDWTKLAISSTVSSTELGYVDGVTSAIQTQIDAKTPELYTFVTDATTSRTLSLSDKFASLKFTSGSATTVTVPANSAVAFPVGSYIEMYQYGAGQITVTQSAGVTVNATDAQKKSRVQYSSITLIKIATDEWLLVGDTAA
jgi:hypothetical protein